MISEQLITLSKIFKDGFTVELKHGHLNQITGAKGYVISIKTLITVDEQNKITTIRHLDYTTDMIIGGWFDSDNNTYYIEQNIILESKKEALEAAAAFKQKAIYDLKLQRVIIC
jgi:hypothetical protein